MLAMYACAYVLNVYLNANMSQHLCGEYKQFVGVSSVLPAHRSHKSKSGSQAWKQIPLPTEPSFTFHKYIFK